MSGKKNACGRPKKGTTKRIDWAAAKIWFLADHTRTLNEVAAQFNANAGTLRRRAATEKWVDDRNRAAAENAQKAAEQQQADHLDRIKRCNEETLAIARAIRAKAAGFLRGELTPAELNAVAGASDKATMQERLALGMATSSSELTGKDGAPLDGGVLVIGPVMSPEEWDAAAKEQQASLTQR